jgi:hypothetical protein
MLQPTSRTSNATGTRLNDRVDPYQRPIDRIPIKRIAIQFLKFGIVQANRDR